VSGPYAVDNNQTTCVDVIFQKSVCQIVLVRTAPPAPGMIDIGLALIGEGKSVKFNVQLD